MSTPLNHHYVSQCQLKEFFNKELDVLFVYDKELKNLYSKKSSKHIFSSKYGNSREVNGEIDHSSLERELKILFEDNYTKYVKVVKNFLDDQSDLQVAYEALCWLTMAGIIGELRHPYFKKNLDQIILDFESDFYSRTNGLDKSDIERLLKSNQSTPASNILSYNVIALRILEKLEPLDFLVYSIESNDHFFLPDTSCFHVRGKLKEYPNNLINEIIQIGMPISDKLFILATPQLFNTNLHGIQFINEDNSTLVSEINKDLYLFAKKAVVCSDEIYLKEFVQRLESENSN